MKKPSMFTMILSLIISVGTACGIYVVYQFIDLKLMNSTAPVAKVDALVVLGAAVWPDGPSPVLADRLLRAGDLYKQGMADKIIVSGGLGKYPPAEAIAGKNFLIKFGIPAQNILTEAETYSTAQQAQQIKLICDKENIRSIALVTSFFHIKRAMQIFKMAGFENVIDARCTHMRFQDLNLWVIRDAIALAVLNCHLWIIGGLGLCLIFLYRYNIGNFIYQNFFVK